MEFYSRREKIFGIINITLLIIFALSVLYPFVYIFSSSISSGYAVTTGKVILFPKDLTFDAYRQLFKDTKLWVAYANTFFYTIFGVLTSMFFSITGAYALSKKRLLFRKQFNIFVAFTMWFNAGMIPIFLNFRDLHLLNSRIGIIIGFACTAFNIILLRNYFENVPSAIEEAARIDGVNEFQMLTKVYLPLSKPALTTVALYYGIARWNGYFWSMILLRDESKIPLQVYLKKKIVESVVSEETIVAAANSSFSPETLIYATIILSIIPVIIIYPYIQKYFNKGVMVGGVKE